MQTRGKREKGERKIRKEGWLSDYSPLYMGAAGESDGAAAGGWMKSFNGSHPTAVSAVSFALRDLPSPSSY